MVARHRKWSGVGVGFGTLPAKSRQKTLLAWSSGAKIWTSDKGHGGRDRDHGRVGCRTVGVVCCDSGCVVRRAKAPHPSGGQSRPATVVPAVMLSFWLCRVRPQGSCRTARLAKFTPHNYRPRILQGSGYGVEEGQRRLPALPCECSARWTPLLLCWSVRR